MKIVLFVNRKKDPELAVTRASEAILLKAGAECSLFDGDESVFDGAYAALSLGGDGTFLRCARYAVPRGVAVLGVHLGHTGYLAHIHPDRLDALKDIASFAARQCSVLRSKELVAVNDFTFTRGMTVQTVSLEIEADGSPLGSFLGDGVIISSALGSTGYALSAGGPVVDPGLSAIVVTPVCAHTSHSHSFVLAPGRRVTVTPSQSERREIYLSADGGEPRRLEPGEAVEIGLSDKPLRCLEPEGDRFTRNVRIHRF